MFCSFFCHKKCGANLSIFSYFFEFESVETKEIFLSHELQLKHLYEIIVSMGGGFYRYKTGDVIKVTDLSQEIPTVLFMGRSGRVSDLYGEKINELFVKNIFDNLKININFIIIAPKIKHYVIYIRTSEDEENLPDFDNLLRENFHYDYCRKLNQLEKCKIFFLTGDSVKEYTDKYLKKGLKWVT